MEPLDSPCQKLQECQEKLKRAEELLHQARTLLIGERGAKLEIEILAFFLDEFDATS